jgi:hypothetical protein
MSIFSGLTSLSNKLVAYNIINNGGANTTAGEAGISTDSSITSIVGTVVSALLGLLGVIFLGLIIYGGITWMTAEGDEGKVESARNTISSSVIGLIIVLAAYAISYFVFSALAAK